MYVSALTKLANFHPIFIYILSSSIYDLLCNLPPGFVGLVVPAVGLVEPPLKH